MKNIIALVICTLISITNNAQAGRSFIESKGGVDLYLEDATSVLRRETGSKIVLKNNNRHPVSIVISRKELKNAKSAFNGKTVISVNGGKEGSDNINYFGPIEVHIISVEAR